MLLYGLLALPLPLLLRFAPGHTWFIMSGSDAVAYAMAP